MEVRKKKVTIKDIAKEAGVSQALVSFVMRNRDKGKKAYRVNEETANRILSIAKSLDYQPNMSARALKNGRTHTIGVVLSDISNPFFAEVARDMENEAYKQGYIVLFGSTDEDPERLEKVIKAFLDKGVDGLVIVPCQHSENVIREVSLTGVPIVLLDRDIEGSGLPSVTLNNFKASFDMTWKLICKGYHHIEVISYNLDISNIRERERGFIEAMEKAGLQDYYMIHEVPHHECGPEVDEIVKTSRRNGGEAFLFVTNTLAVHGMSAIFRGGFHIPQDFGIACFDYNSAFDIYDINLIFAKQPIAQFATQTLAKLVCLIEDSKINDYPEEIVLEAEILDLNKTV